MIRLHIYSTDSGAFRSILTVNEGDIYNNIQEGCDFTLQELPNVSQQWYWVGNKWQDTPKKTKEAKA